MKLEDLMFYVNKYRSSIKQFHYDSTCVILNDDDYVDIEGQNEYIQDKSEDYSCKLSENIVIMKFNPPYILDKNMARIMTICTDRSFSINQFIFSSDERMIKEIIE